MSGVVITSATGGVGVIQLSRPEKFNRLFMYLPDSHGAAAA